MVIDESSVTRTVLPNGLTVLVQTDRSAPAVAIVTYVKAGYFDERDDEIGIAHVLEHMFFKGTPARAVGEIAKQTKAAGGELNAHTIYDNTAYYAILPSTALESGLRIQSDAYANSLIEAAELAKELEVIIEEAKRKADDPSAVATETLFELLHDKHRIRRWRIGREQGLRALTSDRLRSFYRKYYTPSNTVLCISGDAEPAAVFRLVEDLYGTLPAGDVHRDRGPAEPEHTSFRYRELSGDVGQSQLRLGWRTAPALHLDTPKLDVAASILGEGRGSRLYRSVRERRLAAFVSAGNHTPTELGVFVVRAETNPETSREAMATMWAEVARLKSGDVLDGELQRVRSIFDAQLARRLETAQGRAMHLAEWEAMGGWKLGEQYRERFLSVTAGDIATVAAKYLSPERAAALVYRPASASTFGANADDVMIALRGKVRCADPAPPVPSIEHRRSHGIQFEREVGDISVFRSASGVPILVQRKPGSPVATIAAHSIGGATADAPSRAGLTILAARTMLKGTASLSASEIAQATESIGAWIGASAGADSFGWSASVPLQSLERAGALLGEVLRNPSLSDDAFETERRAALSTLALIRDDMRQYPLRMLTAAAFEGHPYGVPVSGTEESLNALSADDAREWHARNVLRSAMAVGVVADIEPAECARIIARAIDGIAARARDEIPPPVWTRSPKSVRESRDKAQTALALAFPGPSRADDSRWPAHLIGTIASGLGGRFFEELRGRKSLAYTVHLSARDMRVGGMFIAYIATSAEKEDEARAALLSEFERLRAAHVTADELTRAKDFIVGSHAISQESGSARLGEMLDAWLFGDGLHELAEYEARVRDVTVADIQRVAQDCFDPGVLVEAIVRGVPRTV